MIGLPMTSCSTLRANSMLAYRGVTLVGDGFIVNGGDPVAANESVRPMYGAKSLLNAAPPRLVIDLFGLTEEEARSRFPAQYQHLANSVQPSRMQQKRSAYAQLWWIFAEPRPALREALRGLPQYIGTVETARHRWFSFLPGNSLPEQTVVAIALHDTWAVGVLSSRIHRAWTLRVGGTLEDRPRYTISSCFEAFPFPDANEAGKRRIRDLGEQLDAHRKRQQALHPELTITGIYNVLEKLRSGEALTAKEKKIHEDGLISVLKQIHDDLDAAVFDAYGWPHDLSDDQILERLVALNAERAEEEKRGLVRWLRPEFQNPAGAVSPTQTAMEIEVAAGTVDKAKEPAVWPKELPKQIAAVRDLVTTDGRAQKVWSVDLAASAFKGARKREVESVLESLAALGILISFETAEGKRWRAAT